MRSVSGWNNTRREVMVDAALLSSKFEIQQPGHRDKYFFALKRAKKVPSAYIGTVNQLVFNGLIYVGLPFKPTLSLHKK
jgi:hypothetical protein